VEQSVELTRVDIRFKEPKTRHGRRSISVPPTVAAELRTRWRQEREQRLALGFGKSGADDLVFHAITLGVYGHLFGNRDDRAATIMEATFAKAGWTD
jgi:hypothetical protein